MKKPLPRKPRRLINATREQVEHPERLAPKKSLGQNFLRDKAMCKKIVAALGIEKDAHVLEIGPGEGALTELLLHEPISLLTSVELDERAAELLKAKFTAALFPHFEIVLQDILRVDLSKFPISQKNSDGENPHSAKQPAKLDVIGNIPYYITSDILFHLFAHRRVIRRAVIMMQREVAERLVAKPRTKEYGILTVATSFVCKAKIAFHVPPGCFFPRPNVTSSVVVFDFYETAQYDIEYEEVRELVAGAFSQRRKMLSNALKNYINRTYQGEMSEIIQHAERLGITYFSARAEELLPQDYVLLYSFLKNNYFR